MKILEWATIKPGDIVREKKSGINARVIDAFCDGELYLDDGSRGISPISAYEWDDFEIVK